MQKKHWATAAVVMLSLGAAGCGGAVSATADKAAPNAVQLGDPDSQGVRSVSLSDEAAKRLGIATQPVRAAHTPKAAASVTIPYAALVYDQEGKTWTYVTMRPLTYLRAPVNVDHIDAGTAYLSRGPQAGSAVVTRGAVELLGAEYEISGE